jgi:hypothetical protein
MKKKNISYFVVGLLIFSSFAALGIGEEAGTDEETINLQFLEPIVTEITIETETYVELDAEGANARLYHAGTPILPMYTTKLTLPFGTKIVNIECEAQDIETMVLSDKIVPAPQPVISNMEYTVAEYIMDDAIYNSDDFYPDNWFSYSTGGGLDADNKLKTFVNIRAYPVRYSPATDTIQYVGSLDLTITYKEPTNPMTFDDVYDLVIITPSKFSGTLQKLVDHKVDYGVETTLKTVEDILSDPAYDAGRDAPEKIKLFIKDAKETWNMSYVLLVGGMKSLLFGTPRDDRNQGTADWHLPVRYTNLYDSYPEPGFISDLYYADIYDSEGNFSSWDSNGNDIFAEWKGINKDILDFYPDVYVGRLACRNKIEVMIMVNKIINYEKGTAGASWYDTMVVAGGDSHDDVGTNYIEGELVCDKVLETYMTEFDPVKLYASNKDTDPDYTPQLANIKREISAGSGHLYFDGHANPASWTTHWVGEFEGPESWCEGIDIGDFPTLRNGGKLPVANVEGCHNSQFNVTLFSTLMDTDNSKKTWCYGNPVPECWSWWLTRKIGGGSIATIGNTALGYGTVGEHGDLDGDGVNEPDCLEALGGYFFIQFYKTFDEGVDTHGKVWGGTLEKYLDTFPGMDDQIDAKTVEQTALLGDPSLKMGGYSGGSGLKARINNAEAGVIAAPNEDIEFHGVASDGQEPYIYEWDFDNNGEYDDATGATVIWSWSLPGVYWVSLKVTDSNEEVDIYDTIVCIELHASTPSEPSGPARIKPGETYTYTTSISATSWDRIFYKFSWGDGTESAWLETASADHSWNQKGFYQIRVQALLIKEDAKGTVDTNEENVKYTDWSEPLSISVPRSRGLALPLLQRLLERYPNAFPILRYLFDL